MITFLKRLVEPMKIFEAPELRRRIIVLNTLVLTYTCFVILMLISSYFLDFKTAEEKQETQIILGACVLIFSVSGFLGHTRHYVAGGLLFTLTIYAGCAIAPFFPHNVQTVISVMPFLIIPALIGAFLFPLRIAVLNLAAGLGLSLGLAFHFDLQMGGSSEAYLVLFNIIAYVILFVGTLLRVWDERQILEDRLHLVKNSKIETLGQMAANIAHEMNTPIGAIILRASQLGRLLERSQESDPEKARLIAMAVDIEKISQEIALTVDGLRRFSRNDEKAEHHPVRIVQVIENTLRICRQKIENNGTRLEILPFDQGLEILGSDVQLSQVLLNILMNALQAIVNSQEKWIQIKVEEVSGQVELSVTDSGTGIPSKIANRIFEPFFSTKPAGEGTGIGLSISSGIIRQLNGRIYVDAQSPNTRFVISLPSLPKKALKDGTNGMGTHT